MRASILSGASFLSALLVCTAVNAADEDIAKALPQTEELLNVVVVSRHGVRSPTQSEETLKKWSDRAWPKWPVEKGFLTPRGFYLVKATWELNRKQSPFTYGTCPKPEDVEIIADVDERTQETAAALNEGLYPGCGYKVKVTSSKHSSIFSPLKAKVCQIENPKSLQEKLTAKGADFGRVYASEIAKISLLTGRSLEGNLRAEVSKHKVGYKGGPYAGSSMTEIFALEWGQFPKHKAAWDELDWDGILSLMPLRVAVFSAINRDMEVARYKGSSLASKILNSLANGPKYTYLIGHDTNLANLGELFDLNWQLPDRDKNENTPGGYLTFEKWRVNGVDEIRVYYSALSPEQIHAERVTEPAQSVEILPRGTKFEEWRRIHNRRLKNACIAEDRY